MTTKQTTIQDADGQTDDECDDCAELGAGWPCAECYISGEAEFSPDLLRVPDSR
jgi:hypothetical protein